MGLVKIKSLVPVPIIFEVIFDLVVMGRGSKVLPLPSNENKCVSYG